MGKTRRKGKQLGQMDSETIGMGRQQIPRPPRWP
jgi:hypothetical protein